MSKTQTVTLTFNEAWVSGNQLTRMHWAVKKRLIENITQQFTLQLRGTNYECMTGVTIEAYRYSSGTLDRTDNLKTGLKPFLDVLSRPLGRKLYGLGVIADDSEAHVIDDYVAQIKIKRNDIEGPRSEFVLSGVVLDG